MDPELGRYCLPQAVSMGTANTGPTPFTSSGPIDDNDDDDDHNGDDDGVVNEQPTIQTKHPTTSSRFIPTRDS